MIEVMIATDLGPVLLAIGILIMVPAILMGGMAIAVALGWVADKDAKDRYEGSELVKLNR